MFEASKCKGKFPEGIVPPGEISVASTKPFTGSFCLPRDGAAPELWNHWHEASRYLQAQLKVLPPSVCFQTHSLTQLLENLQVFSRKGPLSTQGTPILPHNLTAAGLEWLGSKVCSLIFPSKCPQEFTATLEKKLLPFIQKGEKTGQS